MSSLMSGVVDARNLKTQDCFEHQTCRWALAYNSFSVQAEVFGGVVFGASNI